MPVQTIEEIWKLIVGAVCLQTRDEPLKGFGNPSRVQLFRHQRNHRMISSSGLPQPFRYVKMRSPMYLPLILYI